MKVAAFQMRTSYCPAENAEKMHRAVLHAADMGADLLVFPECALSGYLPDPEIDFPNLRLLLRGIVRAARSKRIALAIGTAERGMDGRIFNRALLFSKTGRSLLSYDKVALTGPDTRVFTRGEEFPVANLTRIRVGLQICFDVRFPENWRILRDQGTRLVLLLVNASGGAKWKRPVMAGAVASRAAENGLFVVAANDARKEQMMVSTINDPDGLVLACAKPDREEMIIADLDFSAHDFQRNWIYTSRPVNVWQKPENRKHLLPGKD